MKVNYENAWHESITITLTRAEARLLAAAIRTHQNAFATRVKALLENYGAKS